MGNMVVRVGLGIEQYNKSMRVGTWVLLFAVLCLINVGPSDQEYPDPLGLFTTLPGMTVSIVQLAFLVLGFVFIAVTRQASRQSIVKICSYGMVVATATAVGASVGKVMQMPDCGVVARVLLALLYVVCGIISFGMAAIAATECDDSVYLPVRCCLQLLVNAATGMCVWQDWRVINDWIA